MPKDKEEEDKEKAKEPEKDEDKKKADTVPQWALELKASIDKLSDIMSRKAEKPDKYPKPEEEKAKEPEKEPYKEKAAPESEGRHLSDEEREDRHRRIYGEPAPARGTARGKARPCPEKEPYKEKQDKEDEEDKEKAKEPDKYPKEEKQKKPEDDEEKKAEKEPDKYPKDEEKNMIQLAVDEALKKRFGDIDPGKRGIVPGEGESKGLTMKELFETPWSEIHKMAERARPMVYR